MATIVTRAGKGSPLTNAEVDANFTNINTELVAKANASALSSYQLALGYTPANKAGDTFTGLVNFDNINVAGTSAVWSGHSYTNTWDGSNVYQHIGTATSTNKTWNLRVFNASNGYATFTFNHAGVAVAENSFRAPLFYDSDNTNYFIDPAGSSTINTLNAGIISAQSSNDAQLYLNGNGTSWAGIAFTDVSNSDYLFYSGAGSTFSIGGGGSSVTNKKLHINGGTTIGNGLAWTAVAANGLLVQSQVAAPIFYDSDNTGYYIDANDTSQLNRLTLAGDLIVGNSGAFSFIYMGDVGEGTRIIHNNSNQIGFLTQAGNWGAFCTDDGGWYSNTAMYAPIYYDLNNSGFYVDPNGTSNINFLTVGGGSVLRSDWTTGFQSSSDFVDGTLVSTDIPATATAGESFVIEITGKSYDGSNPPFKVVAQGYLWNDTIIATSGISYGGNFASSIKVFENGGVIKFWWPRISYWNSFNVNVMGMDGPNNNTITRNRVTSITNSSEPTGNKKQTIGLARFMRADTAATNSSALYAPIFYDANNTEYYVSPDDNTLLSSVRARGQIRATGWWDSYSGSVNGLGVEIGQSGNRGFILSYNRNATTYGPLSFEANDFQFSAVSGGYAQINTSFRAPLFYDSDNTAYAVDPSSTSVLNVVRLNTAQYGTGNTALHLGGTYLQLNDPTGRTAVFLGGADPANYYDNSSHNFRDRNGTLHSYITAAGVWSGAFTDFNNTAYYVDPATGSRLGGNIAFDGGSVVASNGDILARRSNGTTGVYYFVDSGSKYLYWDGNAYLFGSAGPVSNAVGFYGPVFYDNDNSAFYADPAATSNLNNLTLGGRNMRSFESNSYIEFTVGGDANTYYPVLIQPSTLWFHFANWSISRGYADTAPWDPIGTGAHRGGLTFTWQWSGDSAWGGNDKAYRVIQFAEQYTTMVGGMTLTVNGMIVWLRGGGAAYRLHGPAGMTNSVAVTLGTYTAGNGATYPARSWSQASIDAEINNRFPIRHSGTGTDLWDGGTRVLSEDRWINNKYFGSNGAIHGAVFTDYNDSSFYLDPTGTSRMGLVNADNLRAYGNVYADGNYGSGLVGAYNSFRYQGVFAMGDSYKLPADGATTGSLYGIAWSHPNAGGVAANLNSHGALIMENGTFLAALSGSIRCRDDMRAPLFYDSNNTAYYVDAGGTSLLYGLNLSGAVYFRPQNWIQMDGGYGIYWPSINGTHVFSNQSSSYGQLAISGSRGNYGGIYDTLSAVNGIMYDGAGNGGVYREANGRWYFYHNVANNCTGFGTSATDASYGIYVTKGVYSDGRVDGTIFYDASNAAFYLDPNATGTSLNVAGSIVAAGNVTAYSDVRVKDNIETVPDALIRLRAIRGVTYTRTDLEDKERRYAGVIAQEIEKALPEAVFGDEQKRVDYNGTIALLIEAVKELNAKVDALEAQTCH